MNLDRTPFRLVLAGAGLFLSGCGAGVAGVVASAGDSGGGNAPPTLSAFEVVTPKVSPTALALIVTGPEGSALRAELLFARGTPDLLPMAQLSGPGVTGNEVLLPASLAGTRTTLTWDFAAELGSVGRPLRLVPALRPP